MRKSLVSLLSLAVAAGADIAGASPAPADAASAGRARSVRMHDATERAQDARAFLAARSIDPMAIPHHQVTTLADAGEGSLRAAIQAANAQPGMAVIEFAPALEGRIALTGTTLVILDSVVIAGPGADRLSVDGGNQRPVFWVGKPSGDHRPEVFIAGLTISGGSAPSGGGVGSYYANLTLADCVVRDNNTSNALSDKYGGGIYQYEGSLHIDRCAIRANSAGTSGGGIAAQNATLTVQDSLVDSNLAAHGAGIYADTQGAVELRRSYIGYNLASRRGGGIDLAARGAPALLENLTITENYVRGEAADDAGGGIWLGGSGTLRLSTISANRLFNHPRDAHSAAGVHFDGPGVLEAGSNVIAFNPVVNGNVDLGNSAGTIEAWCSIVHSPAPQALGGASQRNLESVDPLLQPLADNGGGTLTMAIAADSPARDQGCDFAYTDQRGFPRRSSWDPHVDMGAYEYGADRLFGNGFDG